MSRLMTVFLFIFNLYGGLNEKPIKVLFTAAIIEEHYAQRKKDYIKNLKNLQKYGCDVYVVESCQKGPTFLDKYCKHVYYTKSNDPFISKSANEVKSMLIGMRHFKFKPDDMIIKCTGRYVLEDNRFISFVKNHKDADVIARLWNDIDAYTGYYAIKKKYFDELLDHFYHVYNSGNIYYSIEHALGNYATLEKDRLKIVPITRLYDYSSAPEMR